MRTESINEMVNGHLNVNPEDLESLPSTDDLLNEIQNHKTEYEVLAEEQGFNLTETIDEFICPKTDLS